MKSYSAKAENNQAVSAAAGASRQTYEQNTAQMMGDPRESVLQPKLQELSDNSPQVREQARLVALANKTPVVQSKKVEEEERSTLQGKFNTIQRKPNNTGLPDQLKNGVEALSGHSMDDVKVHYNSGKPAQLNAHAYAQGTDIHIAPGQEKHLPHEAWHVVQQKQGRVKPTMQMKGNVQVNDDAGLEKEADVMGEKASQRMVHLTGLAPKPSEDASLILQKQVVQRARTVDKILNFIDQNKEALGECGGAHVRRLMYWNDQGVFDIDKGGVLNLKTVRKAMYKKIPDETASVDENKLPGFMQVRTDFGVRLPEYFGGGKLWFRKKPASVVFEGRGWISDNIYWKSEGGARYMIHSILEWAGDVAKENAPNPHITLRNAETQVKIDLDISNPLPKQKSRIGAPLEVTRASYSQGLGVNREPGINMVQDESTFNNLKAETTQGWLRELKAAAQEALLPELQPEEESVL